MGQDERPFIARKGLYALQSSEITGSLNVSQNISASQFLGDGHQLSNVTASYITGLTSLTIAGRLSAQTLTSTDLSSVVETIVETGPTAGGNLQIGPQIDESFITDTTLISTIISKSNWVNGIYSGTTTGAIEGQMYKGTEYLYLYQNSAFTRYSHKAYAYGSSWGDDIAVTITIASASIYYPLTGGLASGSYENMDLSNPNQITCLVAGTYLVNWSATVKCASADQYVEGAICKTGTEQMNTVNAVEVAAANKKYPLGGTGIFNLNVGDYIGLCFENETGANNLIIDHANITVTRIDK